MNSRQGLVVTLCHRAATALTGKRPVFFQLSLLQMQVYDAITMCPQVAASCSPGCPQDYQAPGWSSLTSPWQFSFLPHPTRPNSGLLRKVPAVSAQTTSPYTFTHVHASLHFDVSSFLPSLPPEMIPSA